MDYLDRQILECDALGWDGNGRHCRSCNAELPPRRRRWCGAEACDGAYGKHHWWSWARAEALKRDENKCVRCGAESGPGVRLEVHHKVPILGRHSVSGCHHHVAGLETLCSKCHLAEHHGEKLEQLALETNPAIAPESEVAA